MKKREKIHLAPIELKETSVKVVDLKIPLIAVPKLINSLYHNNSKFFQFKKPQMRCRSIVPELLITSTNPSN